jgi:hypothetical protein
MAIKRDKFGSTIGYIDSVHMLEIERYLAVFLGIAK